MGDTAMEEFRAELAGLRAQNAWLRAEVQELRSASRPAAVDLLGPDLEAATEPDKDRSRMSRGQFLRLGAAAAAAGAVGAGGSLLGAGPAGANVGAMQYGTGNNAGNFATGLTSNTTSGTLEVNNTNELDGKAGVIGRCGAVTNESSQERAGVVGLSDNEVGVYGQSRFSAGVRGYSIDGPGVRGVSLDGTGVRGYSESGVSGVLGENNASGAGVDGFSIAGPGVKAMSSLSNAVEASVLAIGNGYNAVYGHTSGTGNGVFGEQQNPDSTGNAVLGISKGKGNSVFGYKPPGTPGDAVVGVATSGRGVQGASDTGTGLEGVSKTGYALKVVGKAYFSRSGVLNIAAGASSATATMPSDGGTAIQATLQSNVADVWVRAVVPNPAAGTFTVYLNKATPVGLRAAWFAIR